MSIRTLGLYHSIIFRTHFVDFKLKKMKWAWLKLKRRRGSAEIKKQVKQKLLNI